MERKNKNMVDKTAEFLQLLENTEKGLDDSMVKTTGKIEMLQEIKGFFADSGLRVVAEEAPNTAAEPSEDVAKGTVVSPEVVEEE